MKNDVPVVFQYLVYSRDTMYMWGEPEYVLTDRKEALAAKRRTSNSFIGVQVHLYQRTREGRQNVIEQHHDQYLIDLEKEDYKEILRGERLN